MNKPVDFELAKLLKEKGWVKKCDVYFPVNEPDKSDYEFTKEDWNNLKYSEKPVHFPYEHFTFINAPTIAEVVMWLYEKYELWIGVELTDNTKEFYFQPTVWTIKDRDYNDEDMIDQAKSICEWKTWKYNTPTEAYIEAIKYCLNNKI